MSCCPSGVGGVQLDVNVPRLIRDIHLIGYMYYINNKQEKRINMPGYRPSVNDIMVRRVMSEKKSCTGSVGNATLYLPLRKRTLD